MAGEPFQSVWISGTAFFLVNSIVYAFLCYCLLAGIRERGGHRRRV